MLGHDQGTNRPPERTEDLPKAPMCWIDAGHCAHRFGEYLTKGCSALRKTSSGFAVKFPGSAIVGIRFCRSIRRMLEGSRSSRAMPSLTVDTRRVIAFSMSNLGGIWGLSRSSKSCAMVRPSLSSSAHCSSEISVTVALAYGSRSMSKTCLRCSWASISATATAVVVLATRP